MSIVEEKIAKEHVTAGAAFVKQIRPFGAVMFLLLFATLLLFCFSGGARKIPDYIPPHDYTYYAQDTKTLTELYEELQVNVFPHLPGIEDSTVLEDTVSVTISEEVFFPTRGTILQHFDSRLFTFVEGKK